MALNTLPQVSESTQWDLLADQLAEPGYFVIDNFLSSAEVLAIRQYALQLKANGDMQKAGIGNQHLHQVNRHIRGDFINWLGPDNELPQIQDCIRKLTELRSALNQTCFLGLKDMELHLAVYPSGTFYKRHSDRFRQQAHRVISAVCYLNPDWQQEDGGQLAMYLENDTAIQIEPLAGRLVLFRSELEHEVLPTTKERVSLTGWMLDQLAGLTFL